MPQTLSILAFDVLSKWLRKIKLLWPTHIAAVHALQMSSVPARRISILCGARRATRVRRRRDAGRGDGRIFTQLISQTSTRSTSEPSKHTISDVNIYAHTTTNKSRRPSARFTCCPVYSCLSFDDVRRSGMHTCRSLVDVLVDGFVHICTASVAEKSDAEMCAQCRRMQTNSPTAQSRHICQFATERRATLAVCRINIRRRRAAEEAGPETQLATPPSGTLGLERRGPAVLFICTGEREARLPQRNRATHIIKRSDA